MDKKWYFGDHSCSYQNSRYCRTSHLSRAGAEIPLSRQAGELSRATIGEFVEI